ncbi:hypothetical protein AB0945_30385 [Streptomyces sp. NPDC005474]|uniref:hypothetical protein n=1 Tax=Streptomyces sp. NPDC005474 TaxID=3154878 RepID=UPI0034558806
MQRTPAATPSEISELACCCAVFVPGDSARTGRVAFWRPGDAPPTLAAGTVDELTVGSAGAGGVERIRVPAVLLPVRAALPVRTRARAAAQAYRARAFRGTATVLGLQLVARGLLLPGFSAGNHDAWWARPLSASDVERVRDQGVLVDPQKVRRAHAPQDRKTTPVDALSAALTDSMEVDGRRVQVRPTGWLAGLRGRISNPEAQDPVGQPAALAATPRAAGVRIGMQASLVPAYGATTNLSRGFTAFPAFQCTGKHHRHSRETTECMKRSTVSRKDIDATSKSRLTFREFWPYGAARIEGVPCCHT